MTGDWKKLIAALARVEELDRRLRDLVGIGPMLPPKKRRRYGRSGRPNLKERIA